MLISELIDRLEEIRDYLGEVEVYGEGYSLISDVVFDEDGDVVIE